MGMHAPFYGCKLPRLLYAGVIALGMVIALLTYHIATAVHYGFKDDEHIFSRYMSASCILFTFALTVRDAWILIVIDRLAAGIRDGRFQ